MTLNRFSPYDTPGQYIYPSLRGRAVHPGGGSTGISFRVFALDIPLHCSRKNNEIVTTHNEAFHRSE